MLIVGNVISAIVLNVARRREELDRGVDEAGQKEDKEDETANHDNAGKEAPPCGQDEDEEDEEDTQTAGCYHVWHYPVCTLVCGLQPTSQNEGRYIPWCRKCQLRLHCHEPCKYTQTGR